jgi:hypothetical protein
MTALNRTLSTTSVPKMQADGETVNNGFLGTCREQDENGGWTTFLVSSNPEELRIECPPGVLDTVIRNGVATAHWGPDGATRSITIGEDSGPNPFTCPVLLTELSQLDSSTLSPAPDVDPERIHGRETTQFLMDNDLRGQVRLWIDRSTGLWLKIDCPGDENPLAEWLDLTFN